jgi:hypothetical protein
MSLDSARDAPRLARFERYALTVWAISMIAFLVWLLAYAAVEFRPSI